MKKLLFSLSLIFSASQLFAVTYTVTSTADSGPGTFRQAILDANGSAGVDDIVFDASIDGLTINITGSVISVNESVVINGNGVGSTIINSAAAGVLFFTTDGVSAWINDCEFNGSNGSALYVLSNSSLYIEGCKFESCDNTSIGGGGAVQFEGGSTSDSLVIIESTLQGNEATANGGAVHFKAGTMIVESSTFWSNTSFSNGGAIAIDNGSVEISNSTFYQNVAVNGAGIYDDLMGLGSILSNCTIASNTASSQGGGFHSGGTTSISNVSMFNCIVANNSAPTGADVYLNDAFFGSAQNNIVESCFNASSVCPVWFSTADPLLDAAGLEDNGGPTQTVSLNPGSPAIDMGLAGLQQYYDQRGELRCPISDIGAYESNPGTNVTSSFSVAACTEYTVPSGDETYTADATVMDTIPSVAGCDSIMTITLTVDPPSTNSISETGCGSYTVPSGDETYFADGVYSDTLVAADGCDSILTIDVTLLNTTSSYSVTACPSYTVPSGDETYTSPGIVMDTISNAAGCDSIMTINITSVGSPSTSTLSVFDCESYTVPSGDETYTASGVYEDTLVNATGCDSVITITVDIGNTTSTLDIDACKSYTTPSGSETFTTAGTFSTMDTILNAAGCDSIITINLDLVVVNFGMIVNNGVYTSLAVGAAYQWIDCSTMTPIAGETDQSFTPTTNGTYAVVVTENGCTDTSACIEITDVGMIDIALSESTKLYPNPSKGEFNILLPLEMESVQLRIYNTLGELVQSGKYQNVQLIQEKLNAEPGLYLVELETPDGRLARVSLVLE